jgi:pyruvate/2-oxoglutarate dehydrogenase complex dihydrolipoamide dehydrogenase (E3) component
MRSAARFGIAAVEPAVNMASVRDHVRGVIAAIAPNDSAERFTALGVRVIAAEARFADPFTVVAGPHRIRARRFVVATGSEPAPPPIPGLDRTPFLTNETVFDLAETPRHLLIVGGGPIGVELAQAHRRLGAAVTIVEARRLLPRDDPEMAAVVERALLAEGVALRSGATIERVEARDGRIALVVDGETVEGSHLLVAAGRRPVVKGLGLDEAGVRHDPSGIVVDRGLRTTNRRVYAIGDCAGGGAGPYKFTHVSNDHAGLVIRSALFRLPVRVRPELIPRVTYTDPELAAVGLSEVIVTARGRILGCAIAAPGAGDLIVPWALASAKGLKVQDLAGLVFPYPTLSEVSKRAAVEFLRPSAQNPWLRRLIGVARRFG